MDYDTGWTAPIGGVTIHQQRSGLRTFDVNVEGVPHYGIFADWFQELRLAADERYAARGGGDAIIDDMLDGAETYLAMWERAVYGDDCVDGEGDPEAQRSSGDGDHAHGAPAGDGPTLPATGGGPIRTALLLLGLAGLGGSALRRSP